MMVLRFPWLWWSCGWLLVAAVCLGSVIPGQRLPLMVLDDKLLHASAYAVLMLWFAGLVNRRRDLALVAALVFLLGLALDLLQGTLPRRTFDWWDVAANAGGILLAWSAARLALAGWCARVERFFTV